MQVNDGGEHTTIYGRHYPNGKNESFPVPLEQRGEISINILGSNGYRTYRA